MGHLKTLDFAVIALYALGVVSIGLWCSRRQKSTEEYFVGGRGMSPFIAGISIIATLVSTISYLATPGEMIKNGPGWMWQMLHIPISFVVVGYFVIPHIMAQNVTSGYELLERRLGPNIRQAASIMFILARLFWMGLVTYTCSFAVATITQLPLPAVLVAVGILGTFYTVLGGIRAVMITDVVQFVVLMGGALFTVGFISVKCGGILAWWPDWTSPQLADLNWPKIKIASLNPFDRVTVLSVVMYGCSFWIMTATADQVVIQRFLTTRDAAAARRSFAMSLLGDMCTGLAMFLTGMALAGFFLRFPEQLPTPGLALTEQADALFPHFIAAVLPAGLTGLVVSALFAAAMSSLDSGISSISTVLVTDFRRIFAGGDAPDSALQLSRARIIGVVVGCVVVGMSFAVSLVPGTNLLEMTVRVSSLLAAPMFVVFALAFFVKSSTPAGAWTAIAVGVCMSLLLTYWQQIVALFTHSQNEVSIALIMPVSALCAFTAGVIVSRFTRPIVAEDR
ncbi:MAG: sodium/solute symporter [Candidatus Hydrogenedentes bacterium]|nr:sodium/solute symporter [Candidatus Hydrogenedentota bacterium]